METDEVPSQSSPVYLEGSRGKISQCHDDTLCHLEWRDWAHKKIPTMLFMVGVVNF